MKIPVKSARYSSNSFLLVFIYKRRKCTSGRVIEPGMVLHTYNFSTQEVEAGGLKIDG
jgi:hypothetical protein